MQLHSLHRAVQSENIQLACHVRSVLSPEVANCPIAAGLTISPYTFCIEIHLRSGRSSLQMF